MKTTRSQWAKLGVFCVAGAACGLLVANTLSVPVRGSTESYTVEFTDVEGLNPGNPVTRAGVRVGRVESIEFADAGAGSAKAVVEIEVESDQELPTDVTAAVRYGDMLGARYVSLDASQSSAGAQRLPSGGTIPVAQTTPPVDLTALMNGFRPLFDALDPDQVNTLTRGFVETFSGQGGAVSQLISQVATMSTDLANQEEVFTQLVHNMSQLLGSVDARTPELEQLLTGLSALTTSVLGDAGQLQTVLDDGNAAVSTLAASMARSNGAFGNSVRDLKTVTDGWVAHTGEFERFLGNMPSFADAVNRAGSYGSFITLYLCNFTLMAGPAEANIFGSAHSESCL
ncbi:MCE family protein [Rhodococcus sp. HNM0569]|uniref:MCE family protein n=1 Tax=Rhodococcus sp. HNM0569 TaxID=2716340 RepID=UPI00146DA3F9|nr:MCE family protein [Rhodococcus sp. HNM0569]NLU81703.1 MCE family protein [Rhodococcus sp. HNM0569]